MYREEIIAGLKQQEPFDLLIIGGGGTGCGIALDAATRGLKVALVEKNDFSEGTSSRSTKLVHGGVRYLEMAIKKLDRNQYALVKDGLYERGVLLKNAPHLSHRLPLVTPLYHWMEVPYIFAGLKFYDILSGKMGIGHSRLVGRKEALERFPMLRSEGLKAGVLYYDGQFNDARMAVTLAITAAENGAMMANHLEAIHLLKQNGKVGGALVRDNLTGETFEVRARGVINAGGPFADRIRRLDDETVEPILKVSSGIHIVLDKKFAPPATGLMIPKTEDGRVLFILPWEGHALIGTTDEPAELTDHPKAEEKDIAYLLRHIRRYFDLEITENDIQSVWSGLRPLVFDPKAADTARLARDHVISESPSGLLTITGGKWTTYRKMAEDAVDQAVQNFALTPQKGCISDRVPLVGGANYQEGGDRVLVRENNLDPDIAGHLNRSYGDRAQKVVQLAEVGFAARLHPDHPYIEAEVIYGVRHEMAQRAIDLLTRRLPLALLDRAAARSAVDRTIEIMADELGWDIERRADEEKLAEKRLGEAL